MLNDVVVEIHFTLTATDPTGEFTVELNSQANLVPASAEEFIPWDQLDPVTMTQWIKNCFTVEEYAKTLAGLDLQLIDQQTALLNSRVERTDLPWGPAPARSGWSLPVMPTPEDYSPVDDAVEPTDQ